MRVVYRLLTVAGKTKELDTLFHVLETRFPRLLSCLHGRLEIEVPAFLVSLTVHGLLLVCLAFAGYRVHQESIREFKGTVVDNLMLPSSSTYQDLDQSANPPSHIVAAGSFAPTLAPTITAPPSTAGISPYGCKARGSSRGSGTAARET